MQRLIALTAALGMLGLSAGRLPAQHVSSSSSFQLSAGQGYDRTGGHDYWYHHSQRHFHGPDVARLSDAVGDLEEVCRHLHEDVHELSQDYRNSAALEAYIDRLDRLKVHLHEILSEAARFGTYSSRLDRHVKQDVAEAKGLLTEFYGLVENQAQEGARTADYRLLAHIREIILNEAFPLLARAEVELYGHALASPQLVTGRVDIHAQRQAQARVRVESTRVLRPSWPAPSQSVPFPPIATPFFDGPPLAPAGIPRPGRGSINIGGLQIRF